MMTTLGLYGLNGFAHPIHYLISRSSVRTDTLYRSFKSLSEHRR